METDPNCPVTSLALDGDRLVFGTTCAELTIRDLGAEKPAADPLTNLLTPSPAAPSEQKVPLRALDGGIGSGDPMELQGRWLAYLARAGGPSGAQLVLLDLQQSREVARIAIGDLLAGAPSNYTLGLSLDTDGTLAASVPVWSGLFAEPQIVWTAVDDPTRHRVAARTRSTAIALAGGLLAVSREDAKAVIELRTGADRGIFSYVPERDLDFDGARVAWADPGAIRREPWPRDPGARPAATSVPALPLGTTAPGTLGPDGNQTPTVALLALKSSQRASGLRRLRARAADPDGRVASLSFAVLRRTGSRCSDLTLRGRLQPLPRGKCTPRHKLAATGTGTYSARLRRRLPAGRYLVIATARDNRGALASAQRNVRLR